MIYYLFLHGLFFTHVILWSYIFQVYWTDAQEASINRAKLNGHSQEVLLQDFRISKYPTLITCYLLDWHFWHNPLYTVLLSSKVSDCTRMSQKFCNILVTWGTISQLRIFLVRLGKWWTTLDNEMPSSPDPIYQPLRSGRIWHKVNF